MDTGLGYLSLGQPATTPSGGEAQRLKICAELPGVGDFGSVVGKRLGSGVRDQGLGKNRTPKPNPGFLYILDEPTVGLHFVDVQALLTVLNTLVEAGNTVLVIEHNLDMVKAADWIIDLGPEGGDRGGEIIFEGSPEEIIKSKKSYTGKYLKGYFGKRNQVQK
jgi:excinuclease ABC subunit A